MQQITGGVCAAKGFKANGIHCGIRKNKTKRDLALIVSDVPAAAAGVYTTNLVKGAPLTVTKQNISDGFAQAVICNSGNANTCNANGIEIAESMCARVAEKTGVDAKDVVVASTGVIGQTINVGVIEAGMPALAAKLSYDGSDDAANAIMTTDLVEKKVAVSLTLGGKEVKMGAIAKGSGMIHPNMGTMLCYITTDCAITHEMLEDALRETVMKTFNRVTVDGDTSTNDMCVVLANGMAGNELIEWKDEEYFKFLAALDYICRSLSRKIAADGEGATKLITCKMHNARSEESAERLAKSVVGSSLVKAAMFGADANWGRVLCAMGYSKAPFRPEYVDVTFKSDAGSILVCQQGEQVKFDETLAKQVLSAKEVIIDVNLNEGNESAECWGCDLTYDYVKINGDYRT